MAGAAPMMTVDQAATFNSVMLLAVEPKIRFGTESEQETTKDGTPKWEGHVSANYNSFGQSQWTSFKVGMTCESNPAEGINPGTPIQLVGFQVGIADKYVKDKQTGESKPAGAQVWYRAESIRSIAATGPARTSSANAASKSAEKSAAAEAVA